MNSMEFLSNYAGGDIYGLHFKVKLDFNQDTPGKTIVTWTSYFMVDEPNVAVYSAAAELFLEITPIKGSTSTTRIEAIPWKENGEYYYFPSLDNIPFKSGTFTITHTSSGEASFGFVLNGNIGGYKKPFIYKDCGTITLANNIPFTNCTGPTSITISNNNNSNSNIITPNGTFKVSWSGAAAGTSNPINSYDVYYYLTKDGSAPTTSAYSGKATITTTSTSGSTTFTVSNASRGYKIVCGVVTKGKNYNTSNPIKTGGLAIINTLPSAPTMSVDKKIVPSTTGSTVTFTLAAGSDSDGSQTKTLYYSTSASGTKNLISSPWKPTVNATTTYYFWTYDGLEYSSSYASQTITKNTKPNIGSVKLEGTSLESKNKVSNYNYIINPTITITPDTSAGQSSEKRYTYILLYGTSANNVNQQKIIQQNTTELKLTISDIRTQFDVWKTNGCYYRFLIACSDGIESADNKLTDIFYITRIPSPIAIHNSTSAENDVGFVSYYSKYLKFINERDTGYNKIEVIDYEGTVYSIPLTHSLNSDISFAEWTHSKSSNTSRDFTLICKIGYSNSIFGSIEVPMKRISVVELNNFVIGKQAFKYFSDQGIYSCSVKHTFFFAPTENTPMEDYGFSNGINPSNFFFQIYGNSKWSKPHGVTLMTGTEQDSLLFNITSENFVEAIDELGYDITQKNSQHSVDLKVSLKNDYSEESSAITAFKIDFREYEDNLFLSSRSIFTKKELVTIDRWKYLKEGMSLLGNFEIQSYNTNPIGDIYIKRSIENSWNYLSSFEFSGSGIATPGNPVLYSAYDVYVQNIGEISNPEYTVQYKLVVTTDAGSKEIELYQKIPARGHAPAVLTIENNIYENNILTINYKVSNFGARQEGLVLVDNKINLYSNDGNFLGEYIYPSFEFNSNTKEIVFTNFVFEDTDSQLVKLGIKTRLGTYLIDDEDNAVGYYFTEKVTDLNDTSSGTVFNALPTVAYRKNCIGINVLEPANSGVPNAIVVIGEAPGEISGIRDTIFFQSASNNNCKVVNFLIDCGIW